MKNFIALKQMSVLMNNDGLQEHTNACFGQTDLKVMLDLK